MEFVCDREHCSLVTALVMAYKLRYFAFGLVVAGVMILYYLHANEGLIRRGPRRELQILHHKSVIRPPAVDTETVGSSSFSVRRLQNVTGGKSNKTVPEHPWSDPVQVTEVYSATDDRKKSERPLNSLATGSVATLSTSMPKTPYNSSLVNRTMIMLFWSGFYSQATWMKETEEVECDSPDFKCLWTSDHHFFSKSDAVLFHARGYNLETSVKQALSLHRPPQQRWVLYNFESPYNTPYLGYMNGLINWTATYMTDSDVVGGRFAIPGVFKGGFDADRNYLENRTGMAAILVSNCIAERLDWVKKLRKYIQVDIYGHCGTPCGSEENCYKKLRKYKFYLSFENTFCMDYVTEKLPLHALGNGIVPVTLSWVNTNSYYLSAPLKSFINALHFPTVKALADYMTKVGNSPELYNEYFKWRSNYTIYDFQILCEICKRLHLDRHSVRWYPEIASWYSSQRRCKKYPVPP